MVFDVVIVGGGPAGLSAALVLGRCQRQVLVCDAGEPRNARSRSLNGFLTRDGITPGQFLDAGRKELERYGVIQHLDRVTDVQRVDGLFRVDLASDQQVFGRAVLLATGVRDHLPDIPGLDECYGTSVHHCPYCDGWEVRGRILAAIGDGVSPAGLALSLRTWSHQILACTHGAPNLSRGHRRRLTAHDIGIFEGRIARLEHEDGRLRALVFDDGRRARCDAAFFTAAQSQQCGLAQQLGCDFTEKGTVRTDNLGRSSVAGI
jgi:thioredoxin reductase